MLLTCALIINRLTSDDPAFNFALRDRIGETWRYVRRPAAFKDSDINSHYLGLRLVRAFAKLFAHEIYLLYSNSYKCTVADQSS